MASKAVAKAATSVGGALPVNKVRPVNVPLPRSLPFSIDYPLFFLLTRLFSYITVDYDRSL